jgi:phospholipid/cholesterol/gamma-HCH transport system substrate-binding protein
VGGRLAVAALVVAVLATFVVLSSGDGDHELRAAFDSVVQVVPGQEVRIGGRKVGSVRDVEESDGQAVLKLGISGDDAWPLHRGTTARLRWGSTSGYSLRYVELTPGPESQPKLADGGLLPRIQTMSPVELDHVMRIFRGRGRADLGGVVDELSATFGPRAPALSRALRDSPPGLDALAEVLGELNADELALRSLVVSGDRTTSALAAREGQLGEVVGHAAQTMDTVATRAGAVRASLDKLPPTLSTSRATLARLDHSLVGLQDLVDKLGAGGAVSALRRMAPPARGALRELRSVAPLAASTLQRGTSAAPSLARLLRVGTPFMPRLGSALQRFAPMAGCIRPYTPEVAGFLSTWIGYTKNFDAQGHYARILVEVPPMTIGTTQNAAQIIGAHSGSLHYAMPRPPGLNAGKPWFQPQCGAGPDALDPSKDPEAG